MAQLYAMYLGAVRDGVRAVGAGGGKPKQVRVRLLPLLQSRYTRPWRRPQRHC